MSIDKKMFSEHLKYKDYEYCINVLREEILNILVKKIQEKNKDFTYTTIGNLKQNCIKYLPENEKNIAIDIYSLTFSDDSADYELACLMNSYKELIDFSF